MVKGFFAVLMVALFTFPGLSLAADKKLAPGTYVVFNTTLGKITCVFYEKEAPKTVQNFIGLAEGSKEWTDPKTQQKVKKPFYDGLIFHRVIPNFMAQGGDPLGIGVGGPGYQFEDEFSPKLRFDGPGRLAMANAGPGTNGSQFFITQVPTPWLDGHHTIFGQIVEGQEIIDKMAGVPKGPNDKPITDIVMKKVTILRVK
jgi:peptidyl-prolyl cis-trans isomerase A (cyclophilin A)